jgi:hypothetical protein
MCALSRSKHVFHELGVLKQINKLRLMHASSAEQLLPAAAAGVILLATSGSENATTGILKAAPPLSVSADADASPREPSSALSIAKQTPPRDGASADRSAENQRRALGVIGLKADAAVGQHTPARGASRHTPTTAGEADATDVLNMSASTASSTNSPFYSPVAHYQYPAGQQQQQQQQNQSDGRHSSGAGRTDHAARLAGSNRSGTPTLPTGVPSAGPGSWASSGQEPAPPFPQSTITHTTPLRSGLAMSASDSRAKVLGGLLFESSTGGSVPLSAQKASSSGVANNSGGTPRSLLHPPSPPIIGGSASSLKPSAGGGSTTKTAIPVPGQIKKVTSHTSICSSLGSNGYLSQQHLGSARSRSHSKADEMMDYAYDIRVLLADSPSVAPAPVDHHYLGGGGYYYGSASSDVNSNASPITAVNSAGNSNCNSRARSRCSSFNQPVSSATYANSNFNLPITEGNLLSRLRSNSGADASLVAEGGSAPSIAVKVGGGGGYSAGTPSSTEDSPTARQLHQQQHQRNQSEGSGRFAATRAGSGGKDWPVSRGPNDRSTPDASAAAPAVVPGPTPQQLAVSGKTKVGPQDWDCYSPSSSLDTPSGSLLQGPRVQSQALLSPASSRSPRQSLAAAIAQLSLDDGDEDQQQESTAELAAGRLGARSPSPAPSCASSLSSCDSLPHNLLDLLAGTSGGAGTEVGLDDSRGAQSHGHRVR